jgi:CheY-like chemotaxis protein/HPt (histidine-containing phosphotransfer) domain-containing protein
MNNPSGPSVQAQLADLARRYREQLPAKLAEIRRSWDELKASWTRDGAESLHRTLHSMAGAGGTMGLPEVSEAAREVERRMKAILGDPLGRQELIPETETALQRLEAAIARGPASAAGASEVAKLGVLPPLRILVADDDPAGRELLHTLLGAAGHTVFLAEDGAQAVSLFAREEPDLVLMDVVMPHMNGYDAARAIKQACGSRFVPLIFLTALQDEQDLARCIAAGGDDFMVKPYNGVLLQAKLIAMNRIRVLHDELSLYQRKTAEEIELSKRVFDAITGRNPVLPEVSSSLSAVGHFCGDLLLYDKTSDGRLVLMLGDFTGHGLAAAIGALPVADVFYPMVAGNAPLERIVGEINQRLHDVLPTGHFCAAVFVEIDPGTARIRHWNGGSPPVWLVDAAGTVVDGVASSKLPLGIVGENGFDAQVGEAMVDGLSALVLYSDGLSEVRNPRGDMLTTDGVRKLVETAAGKDLLAAVLAGRDRFREGREPDDDLSLVVVRLA